MSLVFKINQAVSTLEAANKDLSDAQKHYQQIKALRGQDGYSITVGGVTLAVAVNGGSLNGWMSKMVRGREMIHLGVLKALDAEVDAARERVKACELRLADLAERLAKGAR